MAVTRFAYVKNFELPDPILPGTFFVVRLDGHKFHKFSEDHSFHKPNDERALQLMDHAAKDVMNEFKDIVLAFGESDEYSFLFHRSAAVYNRRQSKILTTVTSIFTSSYVFNWVNYLPGVILKFPPSFDGRLVMYPTPQEVRDYFSWRQADTHVNNLYNTIFWALVLQGGQTTTEAHATLKGTISKHKHEMLHSQFGINYNDIDERFRKGSVLARKEVTPTTSKPDDVPSSDIKCEPNGPTEQIWQTAKGGSTSSTEKAKKRVLHNTKVRTRVQIMHCDIIEDGFWDLHPNLLQ